MLLVQTTTRSVVDRYASMRPDEFAHSVAPKLWVAERFVAGASAAVERGQLTPLEGARRISAAVATLFGYDEFVLNEILSVIPPPPSSRIGS